MSTLYIILFLFILILLLYVFLLRQKALDASLPPLPQPNPAQTSLLLSKLHGEPDDWLLFQDPNIREKALTQMVQKNGKTFLMHCQGDVQNALGTSPVVATADPKLVKQIFLKKAHSTRRPRRMLLAQHLPGLDGILFQDGPKWERHSRTLKPVFHAKNFTQFTTNMVQETDKHVALWGTIHSSSPLSKHHLGQGRISALTSLRQLSTSIALHVGYGIDPNCAEGEELREALDGYDEKKRFRAAGKNICLLIRALFLVWMDARRIRLVVSKIVARIKGEEKTKATSNGDTAVTTTAATTPPPPPLSWIRQMVNANFSIHELANEVGHLHHAHKAIAYMTSFALYEIGKNPMWQDKIRDEFSKVLKHNCPPEKSDLSALKMCTSVWKETLRMHPISLGVIREVGEDLETTVGKGEQLETVVLPRGTMVSILLYALHMDPDQWNAPEVFNPNRWIDSDNTSAQSTMSDKGTRESFVPFLDGKRQCEGRFLAELEFVVFLWSLLRRYDVSVPDDYTFSIGPDFFPDATAPIPLILSKRK